MDEVMDPGLPVVRIKQHAARLQELCANPRLSEIEALEIANISKDLVRDSSRILIWAEGVCRGRP